MKFCGYSIFIFISLLQGCDNQITIKPSRNIANQLVEKIDGNESFPKGIKELLNEEQNLHNKDLWGKNAFISNVNPKYVPEANPKFPLPYYLIPETDAKFLYFLQSDIKVKDQLYMTISGTKYYKLFIHPESEIYYGFLRNAYRYIGSTETEFMASPTSSYRSLLVWNQNNKTKTPFIAKISLDKNTSGAADRAVSEDEIFRSMAKQKTFNQIGKDNLDKMNMKIFPESAGLIFDRKVDKFGGQIIREIPAEVISGDKRWLSFSVLMSPNHHPRPLIMEVIKQSGLSSYDFFDKYMINSYLEMFANISLKNGINFEPHSQNLVFETNTNLRPTGKWILRDFGGSWINSIALNENNGPISPKTSLTDTSRSIVWSNGANYISSFVIYYKRQVFDMLLAEVSKYDSSMTDLKVMELKEKIEKMYLIQINAYFKLNLKVTPDISTYQKIEKMVLELGNLENNIKKFQIKNSSELKAFFERKKSNQEWIELSNNTHGPSDFFISDHGVYEISDNRVVGLALFNHADLENYKKSNGNLDGILQDFQYKPREGCYQMVKNFFR